MVLRWRPYSKLFHVAGLVAGGYAPAGAGCSELPGQFSGVSALNDRLCGMRSL